MGKKRTMKKRGGGLDRLSAIAGTKKRRSKKTKITRSKRGGAKDIEICPICLEELKKGEQIPKLKCKHKFHKSCLEPVCRQKGNVGVRCPLCRGDISFSCVADITRASPWEYNPYTSHTPFNSIQLRNMTDEERDQAYMEIQRHRRNWLARRRRTIRNETPEQRDMRVESESRHSAEMRAERDRYYRNLSQPNVANEPFIPDYQPRSPDYPPPDSPA